MPEYEVSILPYRVIVYKVAAASTEEAEEKVYELWSTDAEPLFDDVHSYDVTVQEVA
jgi:hypothetical protein